MDYRELIEDIKGISKSLVIIEGVADVFFDEKGDFYQIRDAKNSYWTIIGHAPDEEIEICMASTFRIDDFGGESGLDYIEFHLQQTFLERERENRLDDILSDGFDDLFG